MTPVKIIDLDEILGEPKRVKAGGKTWTLPPDLPVELYLEVNRAAEGETELETIERLHDNVLELFRYGQPDMVKLPISLAQCVLLIRLVYGNEEQEPDGDGPPPRARTRGGASSKPRKTTRSR